MLQIENKPLRKHMSALGSVMGPHGVKLSFMETWVADRR